MSTTVSRRVIYIKSKTRRASPKPERPIRDNETLVGEAARASTPLLSTGATVAPPKPMPTWMLVSAWIGGLLLVAGIIAVLNGLSSGRPSAPVQKISAVVAQATSSPSSRGPARGSAETGRDSGKMTSVDGFLNAPFPKRRVSTPCELKVTSDGRLVGDLDKCLEQSRQSGDLAPGQ